MNGASREPDLFMQVIHEKNSTGVALSHVEIEILRQRRSDDQTRAEITALLIEVKALVKVWDAANGFLAVVKTVGKLAVAIGAVIALVKLAFMHAPGGAP